MHGSNPRDGKNNRNLMKYMEEGKGSHVALTLTYEARGVFRAREQSARASALAERRGRPPCRRQRGGSPIGEGPVSSSRRASLVLDGRDRRRRRRRPVRAVPRRRDARGSRARRRVAACGAVARTSLLDEPHAQRLGRSIRSAVTRRCSETRSFFSTINATTRHILHERTTIE